MNWKEEEEEEAEDDEWKKDDCSSVVDGLFSIQQCSSSWLCSSCDKWGLIGKPLDIPYLVRL